VKQDTWKRRLIFKSFLGNRDSWI